MLGPREGYSCPYKPAQQFGKIKLRGLRFCFIKEFPYKEGKMRRVAVCLLGRPLL